MRCRKRQKLTQGHAFQCNKGCLINLEFVEGYGKDDVRIGEYKIQVSRARKRAFQEAMQRYLDLL